MRITANATAFNALYNIQQGRSKLDTLTEKIASELNVNRPSDDPIATSLLLSTNDRLQAVEQYGSNISKTNTWLSMTSTALQGISDTLTTAKSLMSTIGSGTSDQTARESVVAQLTALREQLADFGNTKYLDQYLFSGSQTATKPFDRTVGSIGYNGDSIVNSIRIDSAATEELNITGDQVLTSSTGVNILDTMDQLITAVTNNDVASIQSLTADLDTGFNQITNQQTEVASRITRLDGAANMLKITKTTLENIISDTQLADTTKLAVELSLQETAYKASLSATAKILNLSLLDYL
ncbi:flagellar hook-associated protein FlgL [Pelobacter propionicus]|uniref:Flagellar hook-associated protein 3 n=1 Tax=Pelobacter propionicus (strain DSM 2379 / NBRC 103807 / OttBd1) TaxID=338966 RepID=A1AUM8_PELPD|nr:flagellar hook-associated protein FlgL [Pelobacter propionicus]ABL01049.1 flagellar hook-associated protein 3 [Pelobacter propionicus DSM 2379]